MHMVRESPKKFNRQLVGEGARVSSTKGETKGLTQL